ncbi:MAG: L-histidine N(alpha)-methyltransferase [Thermodesulfovibrionales bacterium]
MYSALASDRIEIMNYMRDTFHSDLRRDILRGLASSQKSIPSKYFYDAYGSQLFETICDLPEYYQTRTELSILKSSVARIVRNFREADIVEFGSGSNLKIRTLLDACFTARQADICYVPVDVSESALVESSVELVNVYPELKIVGMVADFTKHIEKIPLGREKLFVFFGSTIGNFGDEARIDLLKRVAGIMGTGDRFLLGIDMIKPAKVLERAYNDSRGVTAEFNKNVLNVVNRELNADFDTSHFDHVAFYNADKERVEMHLLAKRSVSIEINGLGVSVTMKKGETIHTEICRKFSRESAEAMAEEAGLRIDMWYSDPQGWFSLVELSRMD